MNPKRGKKRFIRWIAIWLVLFQIAIFLLSITVATGKTADPNFDDPSLFRIRSDVLKILSVLENRIEDQPSLEKAKHKLSTLGDRQIRLIASLSDRVEGNTTGSEIAFLLMVALIALL